MSMFGGKSKRNRGNTSASPGSDSPFSPIASSSYNPFTANSDTTRGRSPPQLPSLGPASFGQPTSFRPPTTSAPIAIPRPRARSSSIGYSGGTPMAYSGLPAQSFWPDTPPREDSDSGTDDLFSDDDQLMFKMDDISRSPSPFARPPSRNSNIHPTLRSTPPMLVSSPRADFSTSPALTLGSSASSAARSPFALDPGMDPLSNMSAMSSALSGGSFPPLFGSKPPPSSKPARPARNEGFSLNRPNSQPPPQSFPSRPLSQLPSTPTFQSSSRSKRNSRRPSFTIGTPPDESGFSSDSSQTPRASSMNQFRFT